MLIIGTVVQEHWDTREGKFWKTCGCEFSVLWSWGQIRIAGFENFE